jgi:hypothetical protein
MRAAMAPSSSNFLETFKERGWYLDDLARFSHATDGLGNREAGCGGC